MSLRVYMQDLILAHTSCNTDDDYEEENSIKITIVNDNSSSSLSYNYEDESSHKDRGQCDPSPSSAESMQIVEICSNSFTDPVDDECDKSSSGYGLQSSEHRVAQHQNKSLSDAAINNKVMLDDFRRRQCFLRAKFHPNRTAQANSQALQISPEPPLVMESQTTMFVTPSASPTKNSDNVAEDEDMGIGLSEDNTFRCRMASLKSSIQEDQESTILPLF